MIELLAVDRLDRRGGAAERACDRGKRLRPELCVEPGRVHGLDGREEIGPHPDRIPVAPNGQPACPPQAYGNSGLFQVAKRNLRDSRRHVVTRSGDAAKEVVPAMHWIPRISRRPLARRSRRPSESPAGLTTSLACCCSEQVTGAEIYLASPVLVTRRAERFVKHWPVAALHLHAWRRRVRRRRGSRAIGWHGGCRCRDSRDGPSPSVLSWAWRSLHRRRTRRGAGVIPIRSPRLAKRRGVLRSIAMMAVISNTNSTT